MNAPRLGLPGWQWLPGVLRQRGYWRTVGRFVLWGPLIGGAPYVLLVIALPLVYLLGVGPALVAGMLFASWWHGRSRRTPTWAWRLALGALCGAAAAGVAAIVLGPPGQPSVVAAGIFALHGVPAAMLLALTQKPATSP